MSDNAIHVRSRLIVATMLPASCQGYTRSDRLFQVHNLSNPCQEPIHVRARSLWAMQRRLGRAIGFATRPATSLPTLRLDGTSIVPGFLVSPGDDLLPLQAVVVPGKNASEGRIIESIEPAWLA